MGTAVTQGIGIFDDVRWGTHFCYLYASNQDLIEVLVPYFKKGLKKNALCLWLSSVPLGQQVMEALKEGIPNFDQYRQKGQIEVIPHTEWYLREGRLDISKAIEHASGALNQAKLRGFEGIWVAGDIGWLDKGEWQVLVTYEETVCNSISDAPAVALCACSVEGLSILEALDLFRVHRAIITKRQGKWDIVENLEQQKVGEALRKSERSYRHLFDATLDGIEVIDAATGRILVANLAVAKLFGFASPEQMVGIDPLAYIPAEDRERVAGLMAEAMFEKDLHRVMELKALRIDGSEIWISAVGVKTEYEGRLAGLVSMRDITEQRKAERALWESQRELRAVFDGVRDGIALFDLTGKLIGVNRRILDVGGYAADEIVGKTFDQLDMFGSQDIEKMMSIVTPVSSGEDAPPVEMEVVVKSGQKLILDVRVTPLKRDKDVIGAIAVLRDITERKRAVELLQASEQRNRLLVDNANEGIMVAQDGFVKFANGKTMEIMERLGYTEQEVMSQPFVEIVHPGDRQMVLEAHTKRLAGEEFDHVYQFRAVGKSGETRWIELNSVSLPWYGRPAALVFLNDVTDRRHSEDALRESEKRYRLLAENVTDVIWVTDVSLRPTYVSPSIQRLLGFGPDESLLRGYEDALSPSSADTVRSMAAKLVAADQDAHESPELQHPVEIELLRRDGSTVCVDTTVTIIRDSDGHPIQFLGVLRDVTERKQAEEQLQQSFQKLGKTLEGTIQAIRAMVDTRDRYTAGHQQRVTELSCAIGEAMGLPSQQIESIHIAGLLHDVGKIVLPTEILTKPGRLNEIEFAMIKAHPGVGYDILKSIEFPWPIAKMVLQHHERVNGTGYPKGARGEEILLEARILAVADVVEAMSSHRPYRPALGLDKALDEITQNSGVLYDPRVVDACVRVFKEGGFSFKAEATTDLY